MIEFIVDCDGNIVWTSSEFADVFGSSSGKCYEVIHKLESRPHYCPLAKNLEKDKFCEYIDKGYIAKVRRITLNGKELYYHELMEVKEGLLSFAAHEDLKEKINIGYALIVNGEVVEGCNCEAKTEEEFYRKYGDSVIKEEVCYFRGDKGKIVVFSRDETIVARLNEALDILKVLEDSEIVGMLIYQDDHFVYANRGAEVISGYSKEELTRVKFWEFAHESVRELVRERGLRRQRGEIVQPHIYEVPFYTKSGDVKVGLFWFGNITFNGRPAGIAIFFDITPRIEAEKKLKESEELFKSLFFHSPIGQYILVEGKFELVNETFGKITGYSADELRGKYCLDLVYEEDRELVREKAIEMLKGVRDEPYEYRAVTKDGRIRWILEKVVPVVYKGKRAVLGNFIDITEKKKLEETNERLLELALHLNRMLRHDIKNVISAAMMSMDLLKEENSSRLVDLAEKSLIRGVEIINMIKEMEESIKSGKLKEVSLSEVLDKVKSCYENVEIDVDGDYVILADDTVFSVLTNIVDNAFKHGKASKVRIRVREDGENIVIEVDDDGKGIPEEIKDKIFEYGFSYGKEGGSGIGLYIVKKSVERWGGKVSVGKSELGGAKFTITLRCLKCRRSER